MVVERKHKLLFIQTIIFIILALYGYYDVSTSRQAGVEGGDRIMVRVSIFILLGIEGLYVFVRKVNLSRINTLDLSRPLYFIGGWLVLSCFFNGISVSTTIFYLMFIIWWLFTLKFFAKYTYINGKNYNQSVFMFICMLLVWIALNLKAKAQFAMIGNIFGVTMFVYYVLLLVPFIFLVERKKIKVTLIILATIAVIMSFKRGAIITLPVMLLAYFFTKYWMEGRLRKLIIPTIIFTVLLSSILIYADNSTGGYLFSRFDEESLQSGSGRDVLRAEALKEISQRDMMEYLIGEGGGSSVTFLGTGVHNEWIEAYFSYGLIGVILYLWMFVACFRLALRMTKDRDPYAPFVTMYVAYLLMCSMFSGFLYMHVAFYYWAGMGFFIGLSAYRKVNENAFR